MNLYPSAVICLSHPCDEEFPDFGVIQYLLVQPGHSCQILVKMLETNFYDNHFNSYNVSSRNEFRVVSTTDVAIPDVYLTYRGKDNSLHIVVRSCYHVELDI